MFVLFLVFCLVTVLAFVIRPAWGGIGAVMRTLAVLLTAFWFTSFLYFMVARRLFADDGGGIQDKILELLISHIDWNGRGRALDIGCGNGALAIKLARKYSDARVTGIDYWGAEWGYSKKACEANASVAGVSESTSFQRASASHLPFPDETFDLAVSNLVFHEVKDSKNKMDVLKEALRVVKKGGIFVFQDLFLIRQYYGQIDDLLVSLKESGIQEARFVDTSKAAFIPQALKLPFMVGRIGILSGVK